MSAKKQSYDAFKPEVNYLEMKYVIKIQTIDFVFKN